jgi:type I restriction enzyme R subunit
MGFVANEPKRVKLYKAVARVGRADANLANEMDAAGYGGAEAAAIKKVVAHYGAVRDEVKLGAGQDVDFKPYEASLRFLLDTYIQAGASEVVGEFKDHRAHPAHRRNGRRRDR